jgi:uncharacterized protein (DUF362 family)
MPRPNKADENAVVSLVRSPKPEATQITDEEVWQMVREAVELAGGLDDIVKDGQVVVIKPNLVTTRTAPGKIKPLLLPFSNPFNEIVQIPELVNGITTDRRIAKAMVEIVRELNPSGKVYIMECAGDGPTSENFKRLGYNHENIPGVDEFIALGENIAFRDVDSDQLVVVEVENQKYKKLPAFLMGKYYFDKTYYNADVIISLACLKNHMCSAVTGGIKNVGIGARPANIYANKEGKTVSAFVIGHTWEPINNFIHDYYSAKPVNFVLTDGLQGAQFGNMCQGAPSYEASLMNMRVIMASKDPVAIDTVQSCIVGVDPEKVNHLVDLAKDGFGTIDTSKITIVGNTRVDELKKPFGLPGGMLGFILSRETQSIVYDDYEAPSLSVEVVIVENNTMKVTLKTAPKTTKVEMHMDGRLVKTFTEGLDQLTYAMNGIATKGTHEITLCAYDRLLNCGLTTERFEITDRQER